MEVALIDEECGIAAGTLLSRFVTTGFAEYVLTDDPHYKTLNVKTKWIP